ncbi:MAG: ABC transporter ATP-binding protein [Exilispira sp.]|jgi:ABC-2 type transport system ATP-binding protein|nr:ABC transporter ATP-binding protein [Exilispira sp.]
MGPVVKVENLCKTYRGRNKQIKAVDNISFEGVSGEIFGILGPNGSGKTTTVKSIATIIDYDSGKIFVDGLDNKKHSNQVKQRIGAVLEGARNIYWRLTPVENMIYFAGLKGLSYKDIKTDIEYFLETLDLKEVKNKQVREFSKGMQQKVAVACAFISNPKVILLDEPTLGLDVETARQMQVWIKKIAKEKSSFILVTSHDMKFIENVCERVSIIKDGKIIITDTIGNLKKYFMKKVYKITLNSPLDSNQLESLKSSFMVRFENVKDDFVIFITIDDDSMLYDIFSILAIKKQAIKSIEIENDDFEDVFLEIIHTNGEKNENNKSI